MLTNPVAGYFAIGSAVAAFLAGWTVNGWRHEAKLADALEQAEKARIEMAEAINTQATIYEDIVADLEQRQTSTRQEVRKVYRNVQVPANCSLGPDAARLLEQARQDANAAATGQSSPTLPADQSGTE